MELDRRAFLGSGIGAGALLAAPAEAAAADEVDPHPLSQILADERELLGTPVFGEVDVGGWQADELLGRTLATLLWTGHLYGTAPDDPRAQRKIRHARARVTGMADMVYAHALRLEQLTPDEHRAIDAAIARDAATDDDDQQFLLGQASVRVPAAALSAYKRAYRDTLWRLRKQGSAALAAELVSHLDRVARRRDPDWRARARTAPERGFQLEELDDDGVADAPEPGSIRVVVEDAGAPEPESMRVVVDGSHPPGMERASMSGREVRLYEKFGPGQAELLEAAKRKSQSGAAMLGIGFLLAISPFASVWMLFGGPTVGVAMMITGTIILSKTMPLRRLADAAAP